MHYYNEWDKYAAQWLRNLIAAGHLAQGEVDERSITEVRADDLRGFTQCHFFAGIGGWPLALRIAGWPETRRAWTASLPCQPFSVAGNQLGFADERHLWPTFERLVRECRPPAILGEQVASAHAWLAAVRGSLEGLDYSLGAVPIEAASAGGYQLRDRYFIVARANEQCASEERLQRGGELGRTGGNTQDNRRPVVGAASFGRGERWSEHELRSRGLSAAVASIGDCQVIECADGRFRPLPPPRVRWVGNAIPARVAKLRAFGNAIDPQVAAEFIAAFMDCRP